MRRVGIALALMLMMQAAIAQADMEIFVAGGTIGAQQAQEIARQAGDFAGERMNAALEETDGRSFSSRLMDGENMHLAITAAGEMRPWAKEGVLAALDGCADMALMDEAALDACVVSERLYALPVMEKARSMAVRVDRMEAAQMAYLLDGRSYPAWYPSQLLQALDELALTGEAGMEIWPPEESDSLFLEAILQGVSGEWFSPDAAYALEADADALEDALVWLEDMTRAGLIGAAQSRKAALARFIGGETAIFIDWSAEDSRTYAQQIDSGEIMLMPYPSMTGVPVRAAQTVCVCVLRDGDDRAQERARLAAQMIASKIQETAREAPELPAQGAPPLISLNTLEGGATLARLICGAAKEILLGEEDARALVGRIVRALDTAGR